MKPTPYSEMSNKELLEKLNKTKKSTSIFVGLFLVMIVCSVIITVRSGFSIFSVFPIIFFPILVRNISGFRAIQKELDKRVDK